MTRYAEDWNQITDVVQRKKMQNRIAQRTYRNKLKRRIAELEEMNDALNSQANPQQVQNGDYRRSPSHSPDPSRGRTPVRDGSIDDGSFQNDVRRGRGQSLSPFPEHTPQFQTAGGLAPFTPGRQRAVSASNVGMYAPGPMSPYPPRAASVAGDYLGLTPLSTPLQLPVDAGNNMMPYDWSLHNNTSLFLPQDHEAPITISMEPLDLNAPIAPINHISTPPLPPPVDDSTNLHLAVEHNRIKIVQLLLARNPDISAQDRRGCTVLHIAAMKGFEEVTRSLLAHATASSQDIFALIEAADFSGYTALHYAAENGHSGVVDILSLAGANTRAQNSTGSTALHMAAAGGFEDMVASLLGVAAPAMGTPAMNASPRVGDISQAALQRSPSPINDGANMSRSRSNSTSTAFSSPRIPQFNQHLDVRGSMSSVASTDTAVTTPWTSPALGCVQSPPTMNSDLVHMLDHDGATPLHIACITGLSTRIITLLLNAGAALDLLDTREGFSALHYAAQKGHSEIVRILLESGANVGLKAQCGWNALHLAVQNGHDAAVAELLNSGAHVDERTGGIVPGTAAGTFVDAGGLDF